MPHAQQNEMPDTPIVWSYGGGVQSAAIAAAVLAGQLPVPERVVMADTGREATATWDYLRDVVAPALSAAGLTVEIISHDLSTVDLYSHKGKLLLPAYTKDGRGKLPTFCSNEWKRRPVERHLRALGYGPDRPATMWLGMSTDELDRMKSSATPWLSHGFPLAWDLRWDRGACVSAVRAAGWPDPPKSSCWMCPHRGNAQWRDLRDNHTEDWQAAVSLDLAIRDPSEPDHDPDAFVHRSGVPLLEADLGTREPDLFGDGEAEPCDSGYCFY